MQTKICSNCKQEKNVNCFSRNRTAKDGYSYWCKTCYTKYRREKTKRNMKDGICIRCGRIKENPTLQRCNICREKNKKYIGADYQRKRKQRLINKLGGKCFKCGYIGIALVFHHLTGEKDSAGWQTSKNIDILIDEGKVMLLCANCHRELHYGFKWWTNMFNLVS